MHIIKTININGYVIQNIRGKRDTSLKSISQEKKGRLLKKWNFL